MSTAKVT